MAQSNTTNNNKVKSFSLSAKNKKEFEKKKKQEEEEAAAEVFEQFVATFDVAKPTGKVFVRGNVINPNSGKEIDAQNSGKFYKPDKLQEIEKQQQKKQQESTKRSEDKKPSNVNEKPPKKKGDVKKKSNLESFKEELKLIQEEREERHRLRHQTKDKPYKLPLMIDDDLDLRKGQGSHDTGDPNTTNIYLGNLNPKLSETQLCEIFGRYGPLASVKIMWPRTDEERTRNRNCGFVAFMCRKDGERAMKAINGKKVMDFDMRLGWGKAVPIPPNPIYIPPALRELTVPPPQSGLPFNAQIVDENDKELLEQYGNDPQRLFRENQPAFESLLSRAVVKVVMPTERALLCLIHRVVEFVVREGPMFEATLMSREQSNPMFSFLFDNQSPAHVYYRWRLFSVLQGDHPSRWRTKEFRMFDNGSIWRPPPINLYLQGMPEELLPKDDHLRDDLFYDASSDRSESNNDKSRSDSQKRGMLRDEDRDDFEDMLRHVTPQRSKIAELMVFCIEHADAWEEIVECISDSLVIPETPPFKKISRLYLISDILNNSTVKVPNVSNYRKGFQSKMISIFESFNQAYNAIEGRLKADHFKQRVMNCFRAWEETAIYSSDFLIKLQNIFLGLSNEKNAKAMEQPKTEDIDGIPLDPDALDGEQMPEEEEPASSSVHAFSAKFKPSKWETVDPEVVESQAITSKWENLEKSSAIFVEDDEDDIDGKPMDDEPDYFDKLTSGKNNSKSTTGHASPFNQSAPASLSREVLRDIELKVVRYQDDLESDIRSGRRRLSQNETIVQLTEKFRAELVRKATLPAFGFSSQTRRSRSRSRSPKSRHSSSSSSSYHHSKRYASPPPRRSPSRSPKRRK